MSSSIFDFKAINARCREISRDTFGQGSKCKMCVGAGWVLGPDPRKGFPPRGYVCPSCHNPMGYPDPFPFDDHDYDPPDEAPVDPAPATGRGLAKKPRPF